ncbi:esterase [Lithospermum erythrorhizon]|uniref:Pectinesterase n=1 Tax=Lithospermum erythrorhizon TaxID=34254 RepID=A0AAV3RL99_LITER
MKHTIFPTFSSLLFFSCLIFLFFSASISSSSTDDDDEQSGDINSWCETAPHPEPCKFFLTRNPIDKSDFRRMCIEAALDQAVHAHNRTIHLEPHCQSKKKKAAWQDCDTLFENTVIQINGTLEGLQSNSSFTDSDAQTWLSAALTNIETCLSGSVELNVSDFISPVATLHGNLSQLISNSLAVNGVLLDDNQEQREDYPSWFTERDRMLMQTTGLKLKANVIVAKDGSGHFKSVQAAINYAVSRRARNQRVVVYIRRGVYRENIVVTNSMNKVMLVGAGLRFTVITGSRSVADGFTTYSSATVGVDGIGFIARGITFRNTAGPRKGQAVALRSASDLSVFYSCAFEGYQDTLFLHAQRQFYKSCFIYGTIDFIFGNAAAVFQNCIIYVRKPLYGQVNVITAQGRVDPYQNTGISIHNSVITAARDLRLVYRSYQTFLGRPWQRYSRTVILKTYIDRMVNPKGWSTWEKSSFALNTLYYAEYKNFGPGSSTRKRVRWGGYHVIRNAKTASRFTVANLIAGRAWLPSTGVPFSAGL